MQVSSMGVHDMVTITAEFLAMTNSAFRDPTELIEEMWDQLLSRPNLKEGTPEWEIAVNQGHQREKALYNRCTTNFHFKYDNIIFKKSPGFFKNPEFKYFFMLYDMYEKGTLPYEGGVSQQPARLMDIIFYIRKLVGDKREADHKQQEMKSKAAGARVKGRK